MISSPAQWKAVSSPARFEMIEFMRAVAPCSLSELAERMDRPADSLYHHIRRLQKAGIVRLIDRRKAGRRTEAVYDLMGDDLKFDFDPSTGKNAKQLAYLAGATTRLAHRTLSQALGSESIREEKVKRFAIRSDSAWLDEAQLKRTIELTEKIVEIFETNKSSAKGRLYHLQMILTPVVRRRHAKKRLKKQETGD